MQTVLIVEDDDGLRTSLGSALTGEYRVRDAASGREAIALLKDHPVDVILLDMVMPEGDGFTVLARVSTMRPKPPTIVLTVIAQAEKAARAIQLGASDYLLKPCSLTALRKTIREVLDERRLAS